MKCAHLAPLLKRNYVNGDIAAEVDISALLRPHLSTGLFAILDARR